MAKQKVYTNISIRHPEYDVRSIKPLEVIKTIQAAEIIFLDTETMAVDFDRDVVIEEFMSQRIDEGRKITATTSKSAAAYAEKLRGEMCLDPFRSKVALLQMKVDGVIYVIRMVELSSKDYERVLTALSNKPLVGHNLKFDLKVIMATCSSFKPGVLWDTMIGYKLDKTSRTIGFFRVTLAHAINGYLKIELPKEHGADDWSQPLTVDMFKYAIQDVLYLDLLLEHEAKALQDNSIFQTTQGYFLNKTYDAVTAIEMKFVKVLAQIELSGFPINVRGLEARQKELQKELDILQKPFRKLGLNTKSPAQLLKYFDQKYPDLDIMGTSKGVLARYLHIKDVETILRIKQLTKEIQMIDDYTHTWAKNGRIYSSYNQMRAPTGRMSSSDPNAQQILRKIKTLIYGGTKKRPILKADYPNIEARIMAVVAPDKLMIRIFSEKKDMHVITAATVLQIKEAAVTKDERDKAKPVNFGFLYGMGAKTFVEYAFVNYGVVFTLEKSQAARDAFMTKYQGVKNLHNKNARLLAEHSEIVLRTLLGRRMKIDRFTDANNYPVQGSAADLIKLAAVIFMNRVVTQKLDAAIVNIIHDELVVECSAKDKKATMKALTGSMEVAANYVLELFTTPVEVEVICQ